MQVNIHAAKTHLSKLIEQVNAGESVVISKSGKPVAKLISMQSKKRLRKYGLLKGKIWIAKDFDAPLPESVLLDFEGGK